MTEPRIILDMPEDEYRAHPAIAQSDCTVIDSRSPAHLLARRRNPKPPTQAMIDGRILHCAILEPDAFSSRFCVLPADAPRDLRHFRNAKKPSDETLYSIDWWDRWEAANPGRTVLDADDYDLKMRVADNVRNHPQLRALFDAPGQNEVSIFAHDPETGVPVKARHDRRVVLNGIRLILDPKSTDDCRPESFAKSATNFRYFQQAAFYTDISEWAGEPIDAFLIIAFEKEDPFAVKVYEPSVDDIEYGRRQYRRALAMWSECEKNQSWPCYDTDIEVLTRPSWAKD